ncbi:MAG: putative selenium-dependent hydroxylase accessory protein YqeC [Chloroflexi bacterium]|nr:putative selenium-dependent hydroxylase accessory protein YqeC [Chloroflexota bacterium]
MNLFRALRLDQSANHPIIAFTGSGGKTTALFQLAQQYREAKCEKVFITATSHLGRWQTTVSDHHILIETEMDFANLPTSGVVLFTGRFEDERTTAISKNALSWLRAYSKDNNIPLLIESDGSRQKPLKAPAPHEPPIPDFAEIVVHVCGLSGLGKSLNEENVHRPGLFSQLTQLQPGETISSQSLLKILTHPQGGLKNIPQTAKRIALLNQADSPVLQSTGGNMARELVRDYHAVFVGSLPSNNLLVFEPTAGIILAAGTSSRYGQIKQLLDWKGKPFVRHIAETALQAELEPVVVVTGFRHTEIESQLQDLPVSIIHNPDYEQGQSASIKAGISALAAHVGAAVFLLADQPQIPAEVIRALVEAHASDLQAILAPLVLEEKRANPVLFDRATFPSLLTLEGDMGGRGIFDRHKVSYLPWHDDILIFDVDKPEDYERLKTFE